MKKLITLLTICFSIVTGYSQNDFDYSKSQILTQSKLMPINLTELKYEKEKLGEKEEYIAFLGFEISEKIATDNSFWLMITYDKNDKDFSGFALRDANKEGISKSFYFTELKDDVGVLMQDNTQLTKEMVPGKYYLSLIFKEIPTDDDFFMINVAVTSSRYYQGIRDFFILTKQL